jgi:hypothetical protein
MNEKDHLFKEAIELFKVIDTCLACYYNGQYFMYRPLAAQLRILFCDFEKKKGKTKNNALLNKLFKNIELPTIQDAQYYDLGSQEHLNGPAKNFWALPTDENIKPKIASMPFEITRFQNGLEVCDLTLQEPQNPIPLDEWLQKPISKHPEIISIVDLIRTVADRGGGAHIHPTVDKFLNLLKTSTPCRMGYDALFTIALGRFAQQVGFMVIQFYEKLGTKGKIDDLMKIFDQNHSSICNSAKVPIKLSKQQQSKFSLQSIQYAKAVWLDEV